MEDEREAAKRMQKEVQWLSRAHDYCIRWLYVAVSLHQSYHLDWEIEGGRVQKGQRAGGAVAAAAEQSKQRSVNVNVHVTTGSAWEVVHVLFIDKEADEEGDQLPTLKVAWKARKSDQTNGGYSEEILRRLLSQVYKHWLISELVYKCNRTSCSLDQSTTFWSPRERRERLLCPSIIPLTP